MQSLELKIPPPIVALLFALLMWLVPSPWAVPAAPTQVRVGLAIVLLLVGLSFSVSGMRAFHRARTTMNPIKPDEASSLVSSGVYRLTRNPMYLGLLTDLLAWAVYLWKPLALLALPLFVLYLNRFQIAPEERTLLALFGAEYAAYKRRVRRWI